MNDTLNSLVAKTVRERALKIANSWGAKHSEIVGIMLHGAIAVSQFSNLTNNVGRKHDISSDIDLTIIFEKTGEELPVWLPNFQCKIPVLIPSDVTEGEPSKFNCPVDIYQIPMDSLRDGSVKWDDKKREGHIYLSEVIYDKTGGEIARLIEQKCKLTAEHRKVRIARLITRIFKYCSITPTKCINRGILMNAHDVINEGLADIIQIVFYLNWKYPPDLKWRISAAEKLEWLPYHFIEDLQSAMLIFSHTEEDITRRRFILIGMFNEISEKIIEENTFANVFDSETLLKAANAVVSTKCYDNRQLLPKTVADTMISKVPYLSIEERERLFGLCNEYLISSEEDFAQLSSATLNPEYMPVFRKVLAQIKK